MPRYTYKCPACGEQRIVHRRISDIEVPPRCTHDGLMMPMVRDYRTDNPQPAPMWPEHFNPSSGTVVRTRQQLADDFARNDEAVFERTGIEQRTVVVDAADTRSPSDD